MYVCPVSKSALRDWRSTATGNVYPLVDGVPVLVDDPRAYLSRRPLRSVADADVRETEAPDVITPHLPAQLLGAPGGFGQWLGALGDAGPDAFAAGYGARYAPAGAALDVGCGMAPMARRMVAAGRDTWAIDLSLDAILLARGVLCGGLPSATIPTHQNGSRAVKVPFKPITANLHFAVADASMPPFAEHSFAWVHLGDVLDSAGDAMGEVLVASSDLVARGGLFTITTAYGARSSDGGEKPDPQEELLEALDGLGFEILEQNDRIPHITRHYDRSYSVRFLHCTAARRK